MLTTLIKQRRDSIEQFTKGNRPELAEKEAAEITVIEEYMPKAAGDEELRQLVTSTLAELRAQGAQLGAKDMGTVMKAVQLRIKADGLRADGRVVSEMVKAALAGLEWLSFPNRNTLSDRAEYGRDRWGAEPSKTLRFDGLTHAASGSRARRSRGKSGGTWGTRPGA